MRNSQGRGRPYTSEFRREAVELYKASGRSILEVSKDLGVSKDSLRRWIEQLDIDSGKREGLTSGERELLSQLQRENKRLRQEREILVKAAAFFARETETR